MRRLTAAAAAACLVANAVLAAAFAVPAAGQPSPSESADPGAGQGEIEVPEPIPGDPVCEITDFRLTQLSGLAAIDDGFVVINDGVEPGRDDMLPIFFLNQNCEVVAEQGFFPGRPRDPEDIEYDWSANVLWIGDTGDNQAFGTSPGEPRPAVALWRVDLSGDRTPLIHRFRYEDGPRDAEALIIDGDGTPIIITRAVGTAQLFRPPELVPDNPVEQAVTLELVGEFTPPDTGSEHEFLPSAAARRTITGASVSPDGTKVVLRTYTDAFEFDVADGDVVAAITTGVPRVTPLPGEPHGESITYTPDGERFLTVSEIPADLADFAPTILAYTPTPPAPPAPEPADDEPGPAAAGGGWSLVDSVQDIINLIAAVGVLGLLLVAAGVIGIVRARRRWAAESGDGDDGGGGDDDGPDQPPGPVSGRARPPGAEGRARPPGWEQAQAGEQAGGVYSSGAARGAEPGYEGTEYGGGYQGSQYQGSEYQGSEYQGSEYRGTEYGGNHQGAGYGGAEYGGGGYGGAGYGGGGYGEAAEPNGYHDGGYGARTEQPFDQDWPGDQLAQGHHEGGYAEGRHGQAGYDYPEPQAGGAHQAAGASQAGGTYQGGDYSGGDYQGEDYPGGGYAGNAPEPAGADYYSDDPDYPYEFRERDRW